MKNHDGSTMMMVCKHAAENRIKHDKTLIALWFFTCFKPSCFKRDFWPTKIDRRCSEVRPRPRPWCWRRCTWWHGSVTARTSHARFWGPISYVRRKKKNSCVNTAWKILEGFWLSAPEPSEPHRPSAPEPFGTSSAICPRTLRNLIGHLHRNPLEPRQPSAPELSGTSSAICTGTLWNPVSHLHRNLPNLVGHLHRNWTLWNLISHLHRKAPEPPGTFSGTWCCSCTGSHRSYSGLKTP